jgi:hypothetical protein
MCGTSYVTADAKRDELINKLIVSNMIDGNRWIFGSAARKTFDRARIAASI